MRPDRAIKYRQGIMYAMNVNFGVLSRMAKGEIPYAKDAAVTRAKNISELAAMPWEGFVPVSHAGGRTKAKPEIWQDKAKFDKLADAMQAELPKLVAADPVRRPGTAQVRSGSRRRRLRKVPRRVRERVTAQRGGVSPG